MDGVSIREMVWLESSLIHLEGGWRGWGGSVYKACSERVTTHMEARGLHVGRYPFTTCFVNGPTPTTSTLLPNGLGYFRAKPSPVWIPQLFSNLVAVHLLTYEDGAECSETSAYNIQTPGNYPEGNIQFLYVSVWWRCLFWIFELWHANFSTETDHPLNYLTPWNRFLHAKLMLPRIVKKSSESYEHRFSLTCSELPSLFPILN